MNLGFRIGLAAIAPAALLAALSLYQLSVIDRLVEQNQEIRLVHSRVQAAGVELDETVSRMAEFSDKMRALGDSAYQRAAEQTKLEITGAIDALGELPLAGPEAAAVRDLGDAWRERAAMDSLPSGSDLEEVHARIDALVATSRSEARSVAMEAAARSERTRDLSILVTAAVLLCAGILALVLGRMIVGPVRRVAAATRALRHGQFSGRARPSGPPELAALAEDFNAMAERLGELDRLKEDLLSSVSHDLKAPLASMHETNELLLDEVPGPLTAEQKNLIRLNQGCNARLSGMVADLLDLSRMEAGVMTYAMDRHDLAQIARAALRDVTATAHARAIRIDLDAPVGPVWIECDETGMVRVVENLVANAIRYSPARGTVRVAVEHRDDGEVALTVSDEGPGIPDDQKLRIFDRFYRVDSRIKGGTGTGIGLAIAKSVVGEHGGSVYVEDAAGGGSRFVVRLKAVEPGVLAEGTA